MFSNNAIIFFLIANTIFESLYSEVPIKRLGPNNRPEWNRDQKLIVVQGQINVQGQITVQSGKEINNY